MKLFPNFLYLFYFSYLLRLISCYDLDDFEDAIDNEDEIELKKILLKNPSFVREKITVRNNLESKYSSLTSNCV